MSIIRSPLSEPSSGRTFGAPLVPAIAEACGTYFVLALGGRLTRIATLASADSAKVSATAGKLSGTSPSPQICSARWA